MNEESAEIECQISKYECQGYLYTDIRYRYICPKCIFDSKITVLDKTPFCPQCGQKVTYPDFPSGNAVNLYEFNGAHLVGERV